MLELWNKLHFEEKETESVYHVKNIQYLYLLNKYIKCNFRGYWCGTTIIVDIRRQKVNMTGLKLSAACSANYDG